MKPGQLRHRIQIQRATETNANGEITRVWSTAATRWGSIEPLTGRELWQAQQVQARAQYKVTMRYYPGLLPSDRFRDVTVIDGSGSGTSPDDDITVNLTLNIEHIANTLTINRELVVLCSEAVD